VEGIILPLNLTQPLHIITIHRLQRRPIHSIVGIIRGILEVLAVLDPSFDNRSSQAAHAVVHKFVLRLVVPPNKEARWEDGVGTVGRVCGWCTMCEDVGLQWFNVERDQDVLVFLEEFVTYCLRDKSKNQSPGKKQ
jgi:hypothetical protein